MDRIEALGSREAYLKRVHSFLVFYRKYLANWQAVCLLVVQGLNPPPLEFSRPVPRSFQCFCEKVLHPHTFSKL